MKQSNTVQVSVPPSFLANLVTSLFGTCETQKNLIKGLQADLAKATRNSAPATETEYKPTKPTKNGHKATGHLFGQNLRYVTNPKIRAKAIKIKDHQGQEAAVKFIRTWKAKEAARTGR